MLLQVLCNFRLVEECASAAVPDFPSVGTLCPLSQRLIIAGIEGAVTEIAPLSGKMAGVVRTVLRGPVYPVLAFEPAEYEE